jgi:hypothetical protein
MHKYGYVDKEISGLTTATQKHPLQQLKSYDEVFKFLDTSDPNLPTEILPLPKKQKTESYVAEASDTAFDAPKN